jgi:hypothetical protein
MIHFLWLAIFAGLYYVFSRLRPAVSEHLGCAFVFLILSLGLFYYRFALFPYRFENPNILLYPLVLVGLIIIGVFIFMISLSDEKLETIKQKIKRFLDR